MSPVEIFRSVQTDAYRMLKQSQGQLITSEAAKEAKSWAGVLKGLGEFIHKAQPQDNQRDFISDFRVLFQTDEPIKGLETIDGEVIR